MSSTSKTLAMQPSLEASQMGVTVITSENPSRLTKQFRLRNGDLDIHQGGMLISGRADVVELCSLDELADLLKGLQPNQALAYGLPSRWPVDLTTKHIWEEAGRPASVVPRTKHEFAWHHGPGILMLDYDPEPDEATLGRDDLIGLLRQSVPGLREAKMLWNPSASSHIFNVETGEDLTGLRGQRLYIVVADARDIPRAGRAIFDALWLSGHGYFKVSSSGNLLSRSLVDASVWQTNRLDFAAGASCRPPLEQRRGEPVVIYGTIDIVDTKTAVPDLTPAQLQDVEARIEAARQAKQPEADAKREQWLDKRALEQAGPKASESAFSAVRKELENALDSDVLSGDIILHIVEGTEIIDVTVSEVLQSPGRFDGAQTLDPIEPDYDGGRVVGKLLFGGGKPRLHSFARGGRTFILARQRALIEILRGKSQEVVDTTLERLRAEPDVFDLGGALVTVKNGRSYPLDEPHLAYTLGSRYQYWRWHGVPNRAPVLVLEDPPPRVLKQILALGDRRELKSLKAVITAPTIRLDGTFLSSPGYDSETGLFLDMLGQQLCEAIEKPSGTEVNSAIEVLLSAFGDFPFVGPVDRGIFLAALLTAVVRPILPTSPAFGFDAPVQASGKTLLANCVSALATGDEATAFPHVGGGNDEEVRKRIFSLVLSGQRVAIWDNVVGAFDSPAIAAFLTSRDYSDRVLGRSENISLPNRTLLLLTGNNLTLTGDLSRRVLSMRIDPQVERPFARKFDLDPLAFVLENRQQLVAAALTIIRGYLTSGTRRAEGRMASFEVWDDVVRQTVVWVGHVTCKGKFSDPMEAVVAAQQHDPEHQLLAELFGSLRELFGDDEFTSAQVDEKTDCLGYFGDSNKPEARLVQALKELAGAKTLSARSIGKLLGYRNGRVCDGLRFEKSLDRHTKTARFRVVEVAPERGLSVAS